MLKNKSFGNRKMSQYLSILNVFNNISKTLKIKNLFSYKLTKKDSSKTYVFMYDNNIFHKVPAKYIQLNMIHLQETQLKYAFNTTHMIVCKIKIT